MIHIISRCVKFRVLKSILTSACEKIGITIQGATTLFLANMKRIIKLNEEKKINIDG